MGTVLHNAARVLSSQDGKAGQICLGTGYLMMELMRLGYTHAKLERIEASNSLLSIYPRKSESGGALPLDFRQHGGVFVRTPFETAGWLGRRWLDNFQGRGWVRVDVRRGVVDKGLSMRLLLPSKAQLLEAAERMAQTPFYPGFD